MQMHRVGCETPLITNVRLALHVVPLEIGRWSRSWRVDARPGLADTVPAA